MIIITGAAGFIGSCVASHLERAGEEELVLVDDFSRQDKMPNHQGIRALARVERSTFFEWVAGREEEIRFFLHLGARTDTAERDAAIFNDLNLGWSKRVWTLCATHNIPLIYASSAATYGAGEHGFNDAETLIPRYQPLNPYGQSKQAFDLWALEQSQTPPFWAGLKFFNVYGPNEYHKGRMASVIFHAYNQILATGKMKLFRSHNEEYKDGEQLRDFIYVMDLMKVILFLMEHKPNSGIYNLGTGQARTFNDLTTAVFSALQLDPDISYIETPIDIRDTYQYYTEADMRKLLAAGYKGGFRSLEAGVGEYVTEYLVQGRIY